MPYAKRRPAPNWTTLQRAAFEACRAVYGRRCACETSRTETPCQSMQSVAFAVMRVAAPDELRDLERRNDGRRY